MIFPEWLLILLYTILVFWCGAKVGVLAGKLQMIREIQKDIENKVKKYNSKDGGS